MAETSDAVYKLLNQLLDAYTPAALKEVAEVEALAREMEGNDFQLMPWDWAYYSEKLKNKKFNLNEEELRPYFELSQVEKVYSVWLPVCMASHLKKIKKFRSIIPM